MRGKTSDASADTLTGRASIFIFPQDTASSGLAPESLPSNSYRPSQQKQQQQQQQKKHQIIRNNNQNVTNSTCDKLQDSNG